MLSALERYWPDVSLTPLEERLLSHLLDLDGRVASREELLRDVWGYGPTARTRTVESTVQRVRQKIETDPSRPVFLLTLRGRGYRLRLPHRVEVEVLQAWRLAACALGGDLHRARAEAATVRRASTPSSAASLYLRLGLAHLDVAEAGPRSREALRDAEDLLDQVARLRDLDQHPDLACLAGLLRRQL